MTHNNTYRKNCFVKKKIPPNLIVNRLVYKCKSSSTILSPQFFLSSPLPPFFYYYFFHSFRNIFTVDTACTIEVELGSRTREITLRLTG